MAQLPPDSQAATASQFAPLSAFAVPVSNAIGDRASAPAMVASPNVVRMFFTSFLSPSARQSTPAHADADADQAEVWVVPSRSGTTGGAKNITPPGFTPSGRGRRSRPPAAPLIRRFVV